jgi:uncharacterized protein (DUF2336 family)
MTTQNTFLSELEEALANGSADRRARTLRRITDLFLFGSGNFSGDHIVLFDGVFNHLIVNVEQSARQALAERLAGISNAPPSVVRTLAFDDAIEVAGPVLERSEVLDNATLVENARLKSQEHLLAISRRKTLAETVTDILVERGNRDVVLSTVGNPGARFSEAGYVRLVRQSKDDDELARSVGSRPEIPRQHFLKLLNTASTAVRLALEAAHPENASEVRHVVADVASAIQVNAAAASRDYAAALALVGSMQSSGSLSESDIASFAQAGKFEETVVAFAVLSALPVDLIERAMVQDRADRADTILIVAKAGGLSWPTAKSLLTLCAGKTALSPYALEQHYSIFNRIKQSTAQKIIGFLRKPLEGRLSPER